MAYYNLTIHIKLPQVPEKSQYRYLFFSICKNLNKENQKRHLNLILPGWRGKLIFDHIIRYIDFKEPTFNFMSFFFPFPSMSYCKSILKIQWQFFCCCFTGFYLKKNPNMVLKTKQKSPQNIKPTLLLKIICISPLCSDRKWHFPNYASCWKIVEQGWHPVFKKNLLTYLE